jgi:sugar phosphate isomerase/epimerase
MSETIPTKEQVDEAVREGEKYAADMAAAMGAHPVSVWPVLLRSLQGEGTLGDIANRAAMARWEILYRQATNNEGRSSRSGLDLYEEVGGHKGVARDPFAPIVKGTAK